MHFDEFGVHVAAAGIFDASICAPRALGETFDMFLREGFVTPRDETRAPSATPARGGLKPPTALRTRPHLTMLPLAHCILRTFNKHRPFHHCHWLSQGLRLIEQREE
jgi:hypothetical protein